MRDERILPIFRKRNTLWRIKELEGYFNKLESQIPPDYSVKTYNEIHRALDEIVRLNWEVLHSLEQDFIYSWFKELQTAEEQKKDRQKELEVLNQEMATTQKNSEAKIVLLTKDIQNLTTEISNLKNALSQKKQLAEDLTSAIQNQKLSGEELRDKLEQRIKDMNDEMFKQQKEFEARQIEIGNQFEIKVMELDNEKFLLNETIRKNKKQITQLEKENQDLKKRNRLLKKFRVKLNNIQSVIAKIPTNILKKEGN